MYSMNFDKHTIAIDGPSGSGKTTLSYELSKNLGLSVLETGSLYRCVTLLCLENDLNVNNQDVSKRIRDHDVVLNVSYVSVHGKVRAVLTKKMQDWVIEHKGGILEGRDITTVVVPNAKVRVYLDAPQAIRIDRRSEDKSDSAFNEKFENVTESIALRDKIDSTRKLVNLIVKEYKR